jgi:hypothetical protein
LSGKGHSYQDQEDVVDERFNGMMYNVERVCRTRKKAMNGRCYQKETLKVNKIRWVKRVR